MSYEWEYRWREIRPEGDQPEGTLYWIGWGTCEDYLQYPLPLEEGWDGCTNY